MLASLRDVLGPCPKCVAKPASGNGTHRTYQHSRTYSKQSHYEVLGVERNASSKEIKSAFLKRSKMVHPDANLADSTSGSHDKFVRLNEAYSVLSKPGSRREYDMSMASRWAMQRDLRHPVYHSHTAGGSTRPGSGFSNPEAEERVFWDETLFHQRDKSKDKFYEGKPYYGVNGVKKFPNSYIVFACVGLVFSGVLLHFVALHHSRKMNTRILDERDRRNNRNYLQSKENARVHGTALQLEILKSRVEEKPRSVFNPPPKD